MIWQACRIWEQASGGRVSFQHAVIQQAESAPCRPAHIEFLWRDEPLAGRDAAVGRANRRLSADGWIEAVTIELLMAPAIDVELPEARLGARWLATALHELGHALGLEHSIHPNDVMHFRGWQNTRLSDWDLRQLHGLYPPATNVNAFHRLS
jgi:predicted Zn-dependent protease